jgi:tetratricopeptide (TPR) repeat protein
LIARFVDHWLRRSRVYLLTVVVCIVATPVLGQDDDPGRDHESQVPLGVREDSARLLRDLRVAAGRTREAKAAFVAALRSFAEGLPGTYGDEGPRIRKALADMRLALKRWDDAIGAFRGALNGMDGSADVQVALGTALLDRGSMSDAVDRFRRATTLAPRWGEATLLLALTYQAQGKRQESARALASAVRATPDSPAIGYASVQQAVANGDEGEITRALLTFRDRQGRDTSPSASAAPATPFVRLGLLRETPGAAPVFAPALYEEGFRLLHAGRYDEAVAAFQQAVDRDPVAASDPTRDERVRVAGELRDGRLAEAIARLERALAQWPEVSELRRVLAGAYTADERREQGIEQYAAVIQRDRRDERSRLALAEALLASGQVDAAERVLIETIESMPESAQAYYRLGRLYQSQARIPEALSAFTSSAERAVLVGRDSLYETIAALRVSEGEFSQAIAAYRRELEVNPNNAPAHRRVGDLYAQEGRLGEALGEFAAALVIDPRDPDTHASRAQTLLRMSRFAEAETAARVAVTLRPSHEAAQYSLGTALIRTGKTDAGLAALQEFERLQALSRARDEAAWQLKILKDQAAEHAARQDYRTAADLLRRALAYAPPDGSVQLAAGALLIKAEAYEDAIPLLQEAAGREALTAHRYLAEAYAALHRDDERRAHQAAYEAAKAARLRRGGASP